MKSKTEAEKSHLQKVADIGCIVCRNCGRFGVPAEVRHIRNGAGAGCGRIWNHLGVLMYRTAWRIVRKGNFRRPSRKV
ncbi:TPA: hypothetical protein ACFKZP_08885 [Neisseria gonorrhoeae]|uniref:Phage associated protein n=1 Tax=Neisseria gonorrhoeae TaxID=485 RepID=A0AAX2TNA7_NEIGO|nr:hypothetical protein A9Y61_02585 [Neisseria gonorrhoeae]EEZ55163.1 predicted protein [Neisseria gonorrhoeae PID332]ARC01872.1 hypothetical protein A6J44_11330 [Neisseria gonorrhoeae]ASQ71494.1 hypothetical protein BZG33_07190 [Neisseria gonorrhoeae]AZG17849.1 hypothetical protein EGH15_02930 [Neisseria gonorrhoeae]